MSTYIEINPVPQACVQPAGINAYGDAKHDSPKFKSVDASLPRQLPGPLLLLLLQQQPRKISLKWRSQVLSRETGQKTTKTLSTGRAKEAACTSGQKMHVGEACWRLSSSHEKT